MRYSVCLPAVLRNKEVGEALSDVRESGFEQYEIWGWWDRDIDLYVQAQQKENLKIAALCTRMVPLTDPARRTEYIQGLKETIAVCHKLSCKTVISQVGREIAGLTRAEQHASIVDGLRDCVWLLRENDLTLVIEPLNTKINNPGYYLWSSEEAFQIVEEVGDVHVKVLYDLYHQYVMDDLNLEQIVSNIDKIGHFHMAGYPGRHEPMIDSEIDYPQILRTISQSGYRGSVGLEYIPLLDAKEGLKVLREQLKNVINASSDPLVGEV